MIKRSAHEQRRSRRMVFLGLTLVVLGGLVAFAGSAVAEEVLPPASVVPGSAPADGLRELPTLSAAQEARAAAIALAHPAVSSLVSGKPVSTLIVPWMTRKDSTLLGAGIEFTWNKPVEVSGTWPAIYYDETEQINPPYVASSAVVSAGNVTGVHASVDLRSGRLVRLEPMPGSQVTRYEADPRDRAGLPPQPQNPR